MLTWPNPAAVQHLRHLLRGVRLIRQAVDLHLAGLQVEDVEAFDGGALGGIPGPLAQVQVREVAPQAAGVGVPPGVVLLVELVVVQDFQQQLAAGPESGVNAFEHIQTIRRASAR